MTVEFHSANPHEKLEPRLWQLVKGATSVEIAVAFLTYAGIEEIKRILAESKSTRISVTVSVLFPTNLEAIKKLVEKPTSQLDRVDTSWV